MSVEFCYECKGEKIRYEISNELEKVPKCEGIGEKMFLSTEDLESLKCPKCDKTLFECQVKQGGIENVNEVTVKQLFECCEKNKENDIYIKGFTFQIQAGWIKNIFGNMEYLGGIHYEYQGEHCPISMKDIIHDGNTNGWSKNIGSLLWFNLCIYK